MRGRPRNSGFNVGGPDWPNEMMSGENWRWFQAIIDWEWRDSRALDALIASGDAPPSLRAAVASIREGRRRQKPPKACAAAHIRGADRMRIAAEISNRLGLLDVNKFNADRIAENQSVMAHTVLAQQKALRAEVISEIRDLAAFQSVNNETLEDLVRELRDYARSWPDI